MLTKITEIVVIVAAVLVYLIQRAKYLRDIEPDLELKWTGKIRIVKMSPNLAEFWAYYIDVQVENVSKNRANDMQFNVDLGLFPERGLPDYMQSECPQRPRMHPEELAWVFR